MSRHFEKKNGRIYYSPFVIVLLFLNNSFDNKLFSSYLCFRNNTNLYTDQ